MKSLQEPYFPIGSVVVLKGGNIPLMIYGRKQTAVSDGQLWDYVSVPYPQGNSDEEHTYLFNHDQVETLLFIGFQTEEEEGLQKLLAKLDEGEGKSSHESSSPKSSSC